jgi:hypothetical protein
MRTKQLATLDEQEQHKKASEIGRKVAEFRNDLEAGDTLADWGLM